MMMILEILYFVFFCRTTCKSFFLCYNLFEVRMLEMRNEKFLLIEKQLSDLLQKMDNKSYLNLIFSNTVLKKYDDIISKIDNGDYPENYRDQITDDDLDSIINYLKEK